MITHSGSSIRLGAAVLADMSGRNCGTRTVFVCALAAALLVGLSDAEFSSYSVELLHKQRKCFREDLLSETDVVVSFDAWSPSSAFTSLSLRVGSEICFFFLHGYHRKSNREHVPCAFDA